MQHHDWTLQKMLPTIISDLPTLLCWEAPLNVMTVVANGSVDFFACLIYIVCNHDWHFPWHIWNPPTLMWNTIYPWENYTYSSDLNELRRELTRSREYPSPTGTHDGPRAFTCTPLTFTEGVSQYILLRTVPIDNIWLFWPQKQHRGILVTSVFHPFVVTDRAKWRHGKSCDACSKFPRKHSLHGQDVYPEWSSSLFQLWRKQCFLVN